jgi:hypothetical protein
VDVGRGDRAEAAPYEFAVRFEVDSTTLSLVDGTPAFERPSR